MEERVLFWKYFKDWIETYKLGQVEDITYKKYETSNKQLQKMVPNLYLDQINRRKLQQLINQYGRDHEKGTVSEFMHQVEAPLRDAVYEGLLKHDPTYKVVATSTKPHKQTRSLYLEPDQVNKLLKVFKKDNSWMSDMCDFDLRTGLRFAEVLGLTPKDIDFDNLTVDVNKTWDYKTKKGFKPTKNIYSNRIIKIDPQAAVDLKKHISGLTKDDPIFVHCNPRINDCCVDRWLTTKCKEAGVPRITFHNLRHTHASLLIADGVSIQSVAKRLGHSNTITTQKTYIHLLNEQAVKDDHTMINALERLGA